MSFLLVSILSFLCMFVAVASSSTVYLTGWSSSTAVILAANPSACSSFVAYSNSSLASSKISVSIPHGEDSRGYVQSRNTLYPLSKSSDALYTDTGVPLRMNSVTRDVVLLGGINSQKGTVVSVSISADSEGIEQSFLGVTSVAPQVATYTAKVQVSNASSTATLRTWTNFLNLGTDWASIVSYHGGQSSIAVYNTPTGHLHQYGLTTSDGAPFFDIIFTPVSSDQGIFGFVVANARFNLVSVSTNGVIKTVGQLSTDVSTFAGSVVVNNTMYTHAVCDSIITCVIVTDLSSLASSICKLDVDASFHGSGIFAF